MKSSIRLMAWTVIMVLAATTCPAHVIAQGPTAADARPEEAIRTGQALAVRAKAAFRARSYDEAAKLFMRAYSLTGEAALVFNAARSYEEAGKVGDAIGLFRLYVTIAKDIDGVADAHARIRALEAIRAADGSPVEAKGGSATQFQAETASKSIVGDAQSARTEPTVHEIAAPQSGRSKSAVWLSASIAGIAAVGGVVLVGLGVAESRNANALVIRSDADISRYNEQFDRAELMRNLGWGSLAGAAVAGGLAIWLDHRSSQAVAAVSNHGVVVGWRF